MKDRQRLPQWMKMNMPKGESYSKVKNLVNKHGLHTICSSGNCPNIGECWNRGTATFMILGNICTRNCKFCSVGHGKPLPPDATEPKRVAQMAKEMEGAAGTGRCNVEEAHDFKISLFLQQPADS